MADLAVDQPREVGAGVEDVDGAGGERDRDRDPGPGDLAPGRRLDGDLPAAGSTGTAKAWQPTGTGSSATGRPARGSGRLLPARKAAVRVPRGGPERSAELADRLSGFANL